MAKAIPGGPAPLHEEVVLSPEWLTAVLRQRFPDVEVASTEITERLETVATKIRFRVQYTGDPGDAPKALCAKGYFNPERHGTVAGTVTEAVFYRDTANDLPVRTPPCVHADVDPDTGHGLVLMEDLVEAGATFLDPLGSYGADQAAATLDQLALLHATTWQQGPILEKFPPRLAGLAQMMSSEQLQKLLDDGRAPELPEAVRRGDRLQQAVQALARLDQPQQCLVHGDVHTGNIYEYADGRAGIIDWQVAQSGTWALDLAYHVAAVLDPATRAASEVELVKYYLERLAAHGAPAPDYDAAWWLYRAHLAYGFFMWGITQRVVRPVIENFSARLGRAVADHDSFGLLGV